MAKKIRKIQQTNPILLDLSKVSNEYNESTEDTYSCDYINNLPTGGSDIVYDGEEKVIGIWFGKPLYSKTILLTPTKAGSGSYNHGITNIDTVFIDVSGTSYYDGTWSFYQCLWAGDKRFYAIVSKSQILYDVFASGRIYITLKYTKTTD